MTHLQAVIDRLEAERFVGRSEELHCFRQLLQSGTAGLLNVYGVGGIGKTSLLRAFAREAAATGATWIMIDGASLQPTPRDFCQQLLAECHLHTADYEVTDGPLRETLAACHATLAQLAAERPLVLAIDSYEDIRSLDRWLRQTFLTGVPANTVIVIAGRTPLAGEWLHSAAWRELITPLPLTEFTQPQVEEYVSRCGVSDKQAMLGLWLGTHGHPLALSLALPLAGSDFALPYPGTQTEALFQELTRRWLKDAASDTLRTLVEAAATLPDWDQDTLAQLIGQPVPMQDFEELILLSFVRRTRSGWTLHNLVREAVSANLRAAAPSRFRSYQQRALRDLYHRLQTVPEQQTHERTRLAGQAFYLIGGPLMRQIFASDPAESGYYVEPATPEEIDTWTKQPATWRSTTYLARMLQPLAAPDAPPAETPEHERGIDIREASPTYLQDLLTLDPQCILILRDRAGAELGMMVTIPINRRTLPFLQSQPVTSRYFETLTPTELAEYAVPEPHLAGWYLRAIGLANPEDSTALAALVQYAVNHLFIHGRVLISTPLTFYQQLLQGMGFVEVPGASHYDFGPDVAAPTYCLDLRGTHFAAHMERLAVQAGFDRLEQVSPLAALGLTHREFEVAELVAEGLTNREIAERLHLSEITVKKHLSQVLAKAGLKSRSQLVRYAHRTEAGA